MADQECQQEELQFFVGQGKPHEKLPFEEKLEGSERMS